MKLMIVLAVVGLSSCAKLDKTYLPPNAQTSGGSDNFLQTPNFSGPSAYQGAADNNNYAQQGNGFAQNSFAPRPNGAPTNEYSGNGNGFAASPNSFAAAGNNFGQDGNEYASIDNSNYVQNGNGLGQNAFNADASGFAPSRPERPRAALERNAAILRQDMQNDGDNFAYSFETENGIFAEESGVATNGVQAQGAYSYTGDDGQVYSIRYTADENGFVAQGEHLPTAPPVPEEILKALEQNARDEAAGIFDDGSYQEGKYANSEDTNQQFNSNGNVNNGNLNYENFGIGNSNLANGNQNNGNGNFALSGNQNIAGNYNSDSDDTVVTNSATAYLPPLERQTAQVRNQQPSFANQQPSFARQQLSSANQQPSFANQQPSFANQQPTFANQKSAVNGVTNAYLPPRDQPRGTARFSAQGTQQRPTNFGQRMNGPRRPSFNARDGYQY